MCIYISIYIYTHISKKDALIIGSEANLQPQEIWVEPGKHIQSLEAKVRSK